MQMHMLVIKNTINSTIYTTQELHTHSMELHSRELYSMELHSMELYIKFHFHKYLHYILQLIYRLFFFCTYNFYNLNIP